MKAFIITQKPYKVQKMRRGDLSDQDLVAAQEKENDQQLEDQLFSLASEKTFWDGIAEDKVVLPQELSVLKNAPFYFSTYVKEPNEMNKESLVAYLSETAETLISALAKLFHVRSSGRYLEVALVLAERVIAEMPEIALKHFRAIPLASWEAAAGDRESSLAAQAYSKAQAQAAAAAAAAQISTDEEIKAGSSDVFTSAGITEIVAPDASTLEPLEGLGSLYDNGLFSSLLSILYASGKANRTETEAYCARRAAFVISSILADGIDGAHPVHRHFFRWIQSRLTTVTSGPEQLLYLGTLKTLLPNRSLHFAFEKENVIYSLVHIMGQETPTMQPLYLVGFNLWLLSYNEVNDSIFHRLGIVPRACALIRSVKREKVIRIHLCLFVNLVKRSAFTEELIGADFHRYIPLIRTRNYKDSDINDDLDTLEYTLNQRLSELSSFEMYAAELQAGALRKSPVHNEKFWRENFLRFEDNKYAMIRALVGQLNLVDTDPVAVEVACYDLGEFARFHPDGKKVLSKLGAKTKLMSLMSSNVTGIAKAALLAVQKLMVQKWDQMVSAGNAQNAASPTGNAAKSETGVVSPR